MSRILLLVVVVLVACSKEPTPPSLSEDQLIGLMIDLHTAEMMVNSASRQDRDSLKVKLLDEVLLLHSIDSTTLADNLAALAAYPEYYFKVSSIVADSTLAIKKEYLNQ